jgi:hypothetical protein
MQNTVAPAIININAVAIQGATAFPIEKIDNKFVIMLRY